MATMKLADKGRFRPPPALEGHAQTVSKEVQGWPGIISATHWYLYDRRKIDGADFYVGEQELGHIHLDGEIHLALTEDLAAALAEAGLADRFEWDDAWVKLRIRSQKGAQHGIWLMRLAYDRLTGTHGRAIRQRIHEAAA